VGEGYRRGGPTRGRVLAAPTGHIGGTAHHSLASYVAEAATLKGSATCVEGSQRRKYGVPAPTQEQRYSSKAIRSTNGRPDCAAEVRVSMPGKRIPPQPERAPSKGPYAHLYQTVGSTPVEDIGRRHYETAYEPPRNSDSDNAGGKRADYPVNGYTESDQDQKGKLGAYSVFDSIGRKRNFPEINTRKQIKWPGGENYGQERDGRGNPIDYSTFEHGGPFRPKTLYHSDYRMVTQSGFDGTAMHESARMGETISGQRTTGLDARRNHYGGPQRAPNDGPGVAPPPLAASSRLEFPCTEATPTEAAAASLSQRRPSAAASWHSEGVPSLPQPPVEQAAPQRHHGHHGEPLEKTGFGPYTLFGSFRP